MREHERDAWPFGPARGEPERPLVEAALVFGAFYLTAYLPLGTAPEASALGSSSYHAAVVAINAPRAFALAYLMSVTDGFLAFGLGAIKKGDAMRGLFAAAGALALALPLALLFSTLGITNPLMTGLARGEGRSLALVPLFLASSMATGYAEELFFRSYLMRRLDRAGLPPIWSAIASSLLFGGAHGAQGAAGMAATFLVGLWFSWRWRKGGGIHEIALGHGLYDAVVFAIALYS
jgi:uncharacterized protein